MPLPRLSGRWFDVLGADERADSDDEEGDNAVEPEGFFWRVGVALMVSLLWVRVRERCCLCRLA